MYTQQVVCPACGEMAMVNVLLVDGTTMMPCQSCKSVITVNTNSDGKITDLF